MRAFAAGLIISYTTLTLGQYYDIVFFGTQQCAPPNPMKPDRPPTTMYTAQMSNSLSAPRRAGDVSKKHFIALLFFATRHRVCARPSRISVISVIFVGCRERCLVEFIQPHAHWNRGVAWCGVRQARPRRMLRRRRTLRHGLGGVLRRQKPRQLVHRALETVRALELDGSGRAAHALDCLRPRATAGHVTTTAKTQPQ